MFGMSGSSIAGADGLFEPKSLLASPPDQITETYLLEATPQR
jgi:hypothetical protein